MGAIKKITLVLILLICFKINAQIIKINKSDSIKLTKLKEIKEDNLFFYKDEYNLVLYNKYNILFNKSKKYTKINLAGGKSYCEKCKNEIYYFKLKKTKMKTMKTMKIISTKELFENINKYAFGNTFFLINGVYYKSLGMPIE